MNVRFNGIGDMVATFINSSAQIGDIVTVSANSTVSKAAAGNSICGVAVSKNGNYLGVQVHGAVEVSYTGALSLGRALVTAAGSNAVKAVTEAEAPKGAGLPVLIVDLDTTKSIATMIL